MSSSEDKKKPKTNHPGLLDWIWGLQVIQTAGDGVVWRKPWGSRDIYEVWLIKIGDHPEIKEREVILVLFIECLQSVSHLINMTYNSYRGLTGRYYFHLQMEKNMCPREKKLLVQRNITSEWQSWSSDSGPFQGFFQCATLACKSGSEKGRNSVDMLWLLCLPLAWIYFLI